MKKQYTYNLIKQLLIKQNILEHDDGEVLYFATDSIDHYNYIVKLINTITEFYTINSLGHLSKSIESWEITNIE